MIRVKVNASDRFNASVSASASFRGRVRVSDSFTLGRDFNRHTLRAL